MQDMGMYRTIDAPFAEVVERVTRALREEGFGILSDIDMSATLKKKLDENVAPYRILGACNPALAHRALQAEPRIGLMLPCNVVVRSTDSGTEVSIFDPMQFASEAAPEAIREVAIDAGGRLSRALAAA